jgi:hypothetical protein
VFWVRSSLSPPPGTLLETTVDAVGTHVVMDDGIPVITDDVVSDAQTQGASTSCSRSSAVRVGIAGVSH